MKLFRPVHVKIRVARECRALLSARWLVVGEIRKVENHLRGTLKSFGLKTGKTSRRRFEPRNRAAPLEKTSFMPSTARCFHALTWYG